MQFFQVKAIAYVKTILLQPGIENYDYSGQGKALHVTHAGYLAQLFGDELEWLFDVARPQGDADGHIAVGISHVAGLVKFGSVLNRLNHPPLQPGYSRRPRPQI